jgi:outer membrane lipopolysaccharide assembly protein LptE/RlpB
MEYTANKIEGQNLMFKIVTQHNDEEISFDVVCANDESEIPELIECHLNFLDNPAPVISQQAQQTINVNDMLRLQQSQIEELRAEIQALKGQ